MRSARGLAMRLLSALLLAGASTAAFAADEPEPGASHRWSEAGRGGEPSFTKHVVPLFTKAGCSNRTCHGSFQGQGGFRLSLFGYDPALDHLELTRDKDAGPRVSTEDPDASLILRKSLALVDHGGGEVLEKDGWRRRLLREWIAAGAKFNAKTAANLVRLQVEPESVSLSVDQSVSLRVVATFTDGAVEDVTSLATFSSNDESVVTVNEDGIVSAVGLGDTAVVVSYAGGVVTSHLTVPQNPGTPFPEFPANSPIDVLVAAKLQQVGVHPSKLSTDETFVRRVHVDVIGTLPTADEVCAFIEDRRPDKRQRLIDSLLARHEYAAWWASIFSDWTGNNQSNLNSFWKMSSLWHDWLRDKLGRNVPYDEWVGGIVMATSREGRSLEDYLAENEAIAKNLEARDGFDDGTYARRETLDLYWLKRMGDRDKAIAIRTANAFLGVQIQCAECHKHPFDRWTQKDFEGFTSFFRVADITDLDGSERSGNRLDYDKVALYPGVNKRFQRLVEINPPKLLAGAVVGYEEGGADPREALWKWMRSPENPYFARNIVNRLWHHYFGVGIVDPVDDLNAANPPSNQPLLDWLAQDFIDHDFDLKHLHRRILTSRTYQLSYVPNATNRTDRRNFSHAIVRRMSAEVALDAVARVTGSTLRFNNYASKPNVRAIELSASVRYGKSEYFMDVFGRPKREQTCACERSNEASLSQALLLINDSDIHARIADPNGRLAQLLKKSSDDTMLIDELFLTCLSRYPTASERESIARYVAESDSRDEAMQDVLWSLINVREFLFVR